MLLMLRDKTQGNLTCTEEKFLGDIIASLKRTTHRKLLIDFS